MSATTESATPGRLFWKSRATGSAVFLRVTTERGCRDTGWYVYPMDYGWGILKELDEAQKWHACQPGGKPIGKFREEAEARRACEEAYNLRDSSPR